MQDNFIAGAVAGIVVDSVLFPLDTIKTRLQSKGGLQTMSRLYAGIPFILVGSAPSAALFFTAYEGGKRVLPFDRQTTILLSSLAGETLACLVRVPVEVLKQRSQAGLYSGSFSAMKAAWQSGSLFCGFRATLQRELPFAAIQFPLYEALKRKRVAHEAVCGSVAGGISAFLTTPLDVIKTRKILAGKEKSLLDVTRECWREGKMFAGGGVRVTWISIGGFFFFGAYEFVMKRLASGNL